MRNLELTKCLVLSPEALLSGAQCFCLDCDSGTVWVATRTDLCCIQEGKVQVEHPHVTFKQLEREDVTAFSMIVYLMGLARVMG